MHERGTERERERDYSWVANKFQLGRWTKVYTHSWNHYGCSLLWMVMVSVFSICQKKENLYWYHNTKYIFAWRERHEVLQEFNSFHKQLLEKITKKADKYQLPAKFKSTILPPECEILVLPQCLNFPATNYHARHSLTLSHLT